MLKIKDNVDLKELEKFGLMRAKIRNTFGWFEIYADKYFTMEVSGKQRTIHFYGHNEDLLFDLIQAELVEKVGDEK